MKECSYIKVIYMTQIKIKRVYEEFDEDDGFRVLVDKLWPRGVKKESLKLDYWAKDIAPSTHLREWFHEDLPDHWNEFRNSYMRELTDSDAVKDFLKDIRGERIVTLLYAAKDQEHNHAIILKSYLEQHVR